MSYDKAHGDSVGSDPGFTSIQIINRPSKEVYPDLSLPNVQHILSLILEGHPLSVYMQDENLRYQWTINMPAIWNGVHFNGKGDAELPLPDDIRNRLEELKRQVLQTGKSMRLEGWLSNQNGTRIYAQTTLDPYTLPDGKKGILGKILDLTDQQAVKETLTSLTNRQQMRNNQIMADNRRLFLENERNQAAITRMDLENKGRIAEMLEAQALQLGMLPQHFPDPKGFEIVAYMATSVEVGGDYYDFKEDGRGGFIAALGDATGHGTRAGIIVAAVKSYFQMLACEKPLSEVLKLTSQGLQKMNVPQAYMGLCLLQFTDHKFRYASAGMPPLLVYRKATGQVESLQINSMFLGTHMKKPYLEQELRMDTGDMVVMISDGFTETRNPQNEMLSAEEIADCIQANAPRGPQAVLDGLVRLQHNFSLNDYLRDDSTAVIIMRK